LAVVGSRGSLEKLWSAFGARASLGRGEGKLVTVAPTLTEVLLVLILGFLMAKIAISLISPLPLPEGDIAIRTGSAAQNEPLTVKSPFPALVLDEEVVEEGAAPEDVEDTTLNLTLTGVWAEDEGAGSATITTPDGKQGRFALGDTIVPGVTLVGVYSNQVMISRDGEREALRFEKKEGASSPLPRRATQRPGGNGGSASVSSGAINNILRFAPVAKEGGGLAIEVYGNRDRNTFAALGFQDGDRLVSINGRPAPTDPRELSSLVSLLQHQASARFVVERDGEEIPLVVSLDKAGIR
jgi:type II secretion system protein C